MSYSDEVFDEIMHNVYSLLGADVSKIHSKTPMTSQFDMAYKTNVGMVLDLKDWTFSVRSYKLQEYTDDLGGFQIPPNYVKFKALGDDLNPCDSCSSIQTLKRNFNMEMRDNRLYLPPMAQSAHHLAHTRIYYLSDDFTNCIVNNSFKTLVALAIAIQFAYKYNIDDTTKQLWSNQFNTLKNDITKPMGGEFEGNRNSTLIYYNPPNTIGSRNGRNRTL